VVRVLEPILDRRFIDDSYACRRGKGTHRALLRAQHYLRRYAFYLKSCKRPQFGGNLVLASCQPQLHEHLLVFARSVDNLIDRPGQCLSQGFAQHRSRGFADGRQLAERPVTARGLVSVGS